MLFKSFSGFSVELQDGRPALLDLSPKVVELLCYLLLRSPRPVRRDQIAADLFPERNAGAPRNTLSTLLSRLRTRVRESDLNGRVCVHASTDCIGVTLAEGCDMDALILDRAADTIRHAGDTGPAESLARFAGPFLDGFDADWILGERSRLQRRFLELLRNRSALAIESGDLRLACALFEEILYIDDFQEYAHLGLMAGLAASGQRVRAMESFRSYRQTMRKEMLMDVLPDAKKLADTIASGDCSRSFAIRFISEQVQ